MKRILLGLGTAAGAFALAACGTSAAATPAGGGAPVGGGVAGASTATPRCTTADLAASLGKPVQKSDAPGQFDVPLTYRNVSDHTCALHGVPGVDLTGPDDPAFGPVYHLPRIDNGVQANEVTPGTTASATVTVLTPAEGGASWTPGKLVTIPPAQTRPLTVEWPSDLPVLRQDAATHPGTYVNGILADPA
ncbi:DUF4232 domain-containing protein [Amycolatopsis sp. CA-128772]|uniref:DUF4232 domain-containing protein n=1 Tax=Amycolatopsis sp. CA-128772 TaxID=2073159 RepID=UPI000CD0A6D9|nr:DUF4232 domain-containing protein [Amycolatopsis sp. CA-128772]